MVNRNPVPCNSSILVKRSIKKQVYRQFGKEQESYAGKVPPEPLTMQSLCVYGSPANEIGTSGKLTDTGVPEAG